MTLTSVIYGSQIAMKGITLACKNKWRFVSGSFSISAMGFKCILFIFDNEEDKAWVMNSRPWYLFRRDLLALTNW